MQDSDGVYSIILCPSIYMVGCLISHSRPVNEDMELFGSDASKGRGADGGPRVGSCESARLTFVGGLLITGHARCHVATASQRNRMTD